jgi:hypothetical protein
VWIVRLSSSTATERRVAHEKIDSTPPTWSASRLTSESRRETFTHGAEGSGELVDAVTTLPEERIARQT